MTVLEEERPRPASGEPLVVLDKVDKWFGELHVLKDINLEVLAGEVVVVIGPSGSGKSTLCRAINRLETIQKGTIKLDGKELPEEGKALAQLRAEVGMVFQKLQPVRPQDHPGERHARADQGTRQEQGGGAEARP